MISAGARQSPLMRGQFLYISSIVIKITKLLSTNIAIIKMNSEMDLNFILEVDDTMEFMQEHILGRMLLVTLSIYAPWVTKRKGNILRSLGRLISVNLLCSFFHHDYG